MMAKLKPCPNCHSEKLVMVRIAPPKGRWFYVECEDCYWCGEIKLFKFRAIRAWNKEANNG